FGLFVKVRIAQPGFVHLFVIHVRTSINIEIPYNALLYTNLPEKGIAKRPFQENTARNSTVFPTDPVSPYFFRKSILYWCFRSNCRVSRTSRDRKGAVSGSEAPLSLKGGPGSRYPAFPVPCADPSYAFPESFS